MGHATKSGQYLRIMSDDNGGVSWTTSAIWINNLVNFMQKYHSKWIYESLEKVDRNLE